MKFVERIAIKHTIYEQPHRNNYLKFLRSRFETNEQSMHDFWYSEVNRKRKLISRGFTESDAEIGAWAFGMHPYPGILEHTKVMLFSEDYLSHLNMAVNGLVFTRNVPIDKWLAMMDSYVNALFVPPNPEFALDFFNNACFYLPIVNSERH